MCINIITKNIKRKLNNKAGNARSHIFLKSARQFLYLNKEEIITSGFYRHDFSGDGGRFIRGKVPFSVCG